MCSVYNLTGGLESVNGTVTQRTIEGGESGLGLGVKGINVMAT